MAKKSKLSLNKYLREARLNAGLSQMDVAKELGYTSPQFISNWERGISSPPLETLRDVVRIYAISPQELIDLILAETRTKLEKTMRVRSRRRA